MIIDSVQDKPHPRQSPIHPKLVAQVAVAIALGFAVGFGVSSAVSPRVSAPPADAASREAGASRGREDLIAAYIAARGGLAAAHRQRDSRMVAQFRAELAEMMTTDMTAVLDSEANRIAGNLLTAKARHDGRSIAEFRRQLSLLCQGSTSFDPAFCDWSLP